MSNFAKHAPRISAAIIHSPRDRLARLERSAQCSSCACCEKHKEHNAEWRIACQCEQVLFKERDGCARHLSMSLRICSTIVLVDAMTLSSKAGQSEHT